MDEIREMELELRRLKEESREHKSEADSLGKENRELKSKNEQLVNRLKEASYVYSEAGKRLLYFINNQVNPMTARLNNLEKAQKKLEKKDSDMADSISSGVERMDRQDVKLEKKRREILRKMNESGSALEKKISSDVSGLEKRMDRMKVAIERKNSAKISSVKKETEEKMDILKERNIFLGKEIKAVKKFAHDISKLEGRLNEAIFQLSHLKMEMEGMKPPRKRK